MADSICYERLYDDRKPVAAVPVGGAQRDLIPLVPASRDEDVSRGDAGFGGSQRETQDHETGKIGSTLGAEQNNSPQERCGGNEATQATV